MEYNLYYQLRRQQSAIIKLTYHKPGELHDRLHSRAVREYSEKLTKYYYTQTKDNTVWEDTRRMYALYLTLAPAAARLCPRHCSPAWHVGTVLNWLRQQSNSRRKLWYVTLKEIPFPERADALLADRMRSYGIDDSSIISEAVDLYRCYGTVKGSRGELLKTILRPWIMPRVDEGIRYAGTEISVSQYYNTKSVDVRGGIKLFGYDIRYNAENAKGKYSIRLTDETVTEIRNELKQIIESKAQPQYKAVALKKAIKRLVFRYRYAVSSQPQWYELAHWLGQKIKRIKAQFHAAGEIPRYLLAIVEKEVREGIYSVKTPSFYFRPDEIEESVFLGMHSPYREWV